MRCIDKPNFSTADVFDACIGNVKSPIVFARLKAARTQILANFALYDVQAASNQLSSFVPSAWAKDEQIVLAGISKKEFVDLYTDDMVGDGGAGRKYYDSLMMLAPLGKCPYCGFGQVATLDHFLSKSRYPSFSVLCTNLVPACTDCNKKMGSSVVTPKNIMLHPYFEQKILETDAWLFADIVETGPPSIRFFVRAPAYWTDELKARTSNHFRELNLASRFGVEAATELAGLVDLLDDLETQEQREAHLSRVARVERRARKNTWKAAMYEAVSVSNWYQIGGYRLSLK